MKKLFIALSAFCLVPALTFASEAAEVAEHAEVAEKSIMDSPIIPAMIEFIPMLLTFALLLFVLTKFVWPIVLKVLDERAEKIEGSLKKAEEAKLEAEGLLSETQEKVSAAQKESATIVEAGKLAGDEERAEIVKRAEAEAAKIVEQGYASLKVEREAALDKMKEDSAKLAVTIAEKILNEKITAKVDAAMIEAAIADMGGFND